MSATNIAIGIATEYKGQGVTKAKSDLASLGGEAKKLAGYFGASLGTAAVVSFGVAAVKAFAADNVSAKILSNTLDNLGLAFADIPIEKFITNMSEANGIAKSDLRTSFDTLVRATGSATKSQDLLNLSLNVSSGTGKNLALVSGAIAKAYGGNVTALSRLGAGLSKVDLKTKSFVQLQAELNTLFAGDATTAADSYSGTINRLKESFNQFKITIGTGIVDALTAVGSSSGLAGFQSSMDAIAKDVSYVITGMGVIAGEAERAAASVNKHSFGAGGLVAKAVGDSLLIAPIKILYNLGKTKQATVAIAAAGSKVTDSYHDSISAANQLATATAKIAATAKLTASAALTAANKLKQAAADKLALERASLALKLAGQTTDMANIEIQAALQRGQSQQVDNILLLQRALIDQNAAQASILSQEVLRAQGLVMDVNGNISTLAGAKNPFADWPQFDAAANATLADMQAALDKINADVAKQRLKDLADYLAAMKDKTITVTVNTVNSAGAVLPGYQDAPLSGTSKFGGAGGATSSVVIAPDAPITGTSMFGGAGGPTTGAAVIPAPVTVNVTLNGAAVANAVQQTIVDNTASGTSSTYTRSLMGVW